MTPPRPFTKTIQWDDIKVTFTQRSWGLWKNSKGETRVFVSLKGVSFINHTFWLADVAVEKETGVPIPFRAETRAAILLTMTRELKHKLEAIKPWLLPNPIIHNPLPSA